MEILYLFPKKLWSSKMSPGRRWYAEALNSQPGVEVKTWGPGWAGFDANLSLDQNIKYAGFEPDWLWLYKPEEMRGVKECEIPKFCTYNECWLGIPGKALAEVESYGTDIVVCHHENDTRMFDGFSGKIYHIPHGAPKRLFYNENPVSERPTDVLLSGVQSPEIYPLRHRYRVLAQSGAFPCKIRKHPGYRLQGEKMCDMQAEDYAKDVRSAKISLCCSSERRYFLAKIIESLMSGCIVMTDAPDDSVFDDIRPYVVTVPDGVGDEWISNKINDILSRIEEFDHIASMGASYAAANLSTDQWAQSVLACLR